MINGTFVLDSEGLSSLVRRDRLMTEVLATALTDDVDVVVSAVTLVEVSHPKINRAAFDWTVSRLTVLPVTQQIATEASRLLADAGIHGHRAAIDAMVVATALDAYSPATIFTSDPTDMTRLAGGVVGVVTL